MVLLLKRGANADTFDVDGKVSPILLGAPQGLQFLLLWFLNHDGFLQELVV